MPQVDIDVANVRTMQSELAAAALPRSVATREPPVEASPRPLLVAAGLLSLLWLGLSGLYGFALYNDGSLASLALEQGVIYGIAFALPLLAIWLLTITLIQARALKHTSRLINDSLLAMTYPDDDARQRLASVMRGLSAQAEELSRASDLARGRADAVDQVLRRQTDALREASAAVEKGSGQAGALLTAQAGALDGALDALRERASGIEATIATAAENLARISSQSLESTRTAQAAMADRSDDLLTAAEQAARRTESISETYTGIVGRLDNATATAARQIEDINQGYAAQAQAMVAAGDTLAAKMREITELARREVTAIEEAGERSRDRASQMEQTVAAHGKRLSTLADETRSWINQTADHFALQAQFMKDLSAEALQGLNNGIGDAVSKVDDAGRHFISLTTSLQARSGEATSFMDQAGQRLRQNAQEITTEWQSAAQAAAEQARQSAISFRARAAELERTAETTVNNIAQASQAMGEKLGTDSEAMVQMADAALGRTDALRQALQAASGDVGTASDAAARTLDGARDQIAAQITRLDEAAEATAARARALGDQFAAETERFSGTIGDTETGISSLRQTVDGTVSMLRTLADEITEKTRALDESVTSNSGAVSRIMDEAVAEARQVEAALGSAAAGLTQSSTAARDSLRGATADMLEQIRQLQAISADGVRDLTAASAGIGQNAAALGETSDTAAQRLQSLRQALTDHDQAAQLAGGNAAARVAQAGEMLNAAGTSLNAAAEDAAGKLGRSAEDLSIRASEVRQAAEDAAGSVAQTSDALQANAALIAAFSREAEQFRTRADSLIEGARELAQAATTAGAQAGQADDTFRDRADRLLAMAETLGQRLSAMEALERQTTGANFARTASNILESLGSVAIDLNRLLEAEIPQKVWGQYREGDTQAFARHIVKSGGRDLGNKIAARFASNPDFRDYVTRYIAHFEGLMRQSMDNERTDTMAASLLSSDMGKLYVVLAKAINRLR